MGKVNLWRGLTAVFAVLLSLAIFMSALMLKWEGNINLALGTLPPLREVTDDTNYYASDYGVNPEGYAKMIADSDVHDTNTMAEGAVLVKNEGNALPLKSTERRVTLFGRSVADPVYRGNSGGPAPEASRQVSLKSALEGAGFTINQTLYNAYAGSNVSRVKVPVENRDGLKSSIGEVPSSFYTADLKASYASDFNDVAIVMFSRDAGEGRDLFYNDADGVSQLSLHESEASLLKMIKESGKFDKTIVLINSAYAMELGWVEEEEYGVDACLWIGGTGLKGFLGVANILTGKADPSGHFVDTYATDSLSSAAVQNAFNHSFTNGGNYIVEAEGIYVGYKYYETRYQDQVLDINNATGKKGAFVNKSGWDYAEEMAYPFGYGLSYTNFTQEVKSIVWDRAAHTVTATVKVTNEGNEDSSYTGKSKSVVQLYVQLPWEKGQAEKSAIQLIGFGKTGLLGAGEDETVEIVVDDYLFATYDMKATNGADTTKTGCYVYDAGDYYFAIGNDSHDALNNVLAAREKTGMVDQFGNPVDGDADKVVKDTLDVTDNKTYAVSQYTGNVVSNLFEDVDINYFFDEDVVTYLTRADWNTFPDTYDNLTATAAMREQMNDTGYTKPKDAPAYDSFTQGAEVTLKLVDMRDIPYDDERWDTFINQLTIDNMTSMVGESFGQKAVTTVGKPVNSNSDGPAGPQAGYNGHPPTVRVNEVVAASTWNSELLAERGSFIAEDCLFGNTTQLWSPGCNIHRTPFSGRNFEYYSEDSIMSYLCSSVQVAAMQAKGCNAAPKHFAGNDQETNRENICQYGTEQAFRQGSFKGFEGAFTVGGALGTMMSFARIGNHYFYTYSNLLTDVLRGEWGFKGVTITDSVANWTTSNPTLASLVAGTDTFNARAACGSEVKMYLVQNKDGYMLQQLRTAAKHFFYAMSRSNLINGLSTDTVVEDFVPWWKPAILGIQIGLGVITAGLLAMYIVSRYVLKGKKKEEEAQS